MSNEVLVKRLHVALLRRQTQDSWTWGEQQHLIDVLSDAITALSQPTYDDGLEALAEKLQGAGAKGETLVEWHQRIGGCNREVAQLCAELDRRLDAMEVK